MIDWQALATPTGRLTKEHADEVKGMLTTNYVDLSDELRKTIETDNDLSDYWYFSDTALHHCGDVWDNRRVSVKSKR